MAILAFGLARLTTGTAENLGWSGWDTKLLYVSLLQAVHESAATKGLESVADRLTPCTCWKKD